MVSDMHSKIMWEDLEDPSEVLAFVEDIFMARRYELLRADSNVAQLLQPDAAGQPPGSLAVVVPPGAARLGDSFPAGKQELSFGDEDGDDDDDVSVEDELLEDVNGFELEEELYWELLDLYKNPQRLIA